MTADALDLDAPLRLDVWADVACPWCFVGTMRLDAVLESASRQGTRVVVRHRPFELNPDLPPEGVPMAGYLESRLGSPEALAGAHARLVELGAEVGIAFDFAAVGKAPNSRLAHHLLTTYDGDPRQHRAVRALYSGYFERGRDVTDVETLVELVSTATGEGAAEVRARLEAPRDGLDAALRLGRDLGVTAVPTFVADAGPDPDPETGLSAAVVAMQGAQPAEALEQLLAEARRRASA
jgi:predicted DsbA family dithiol-disulfide isomerase